MFIFFKSEIIDLAEAILVTNTPLSLLRWLKRHPSVHRVSESYDEDSLLSYLQQVLRPKNKTEMNVGIAYATLVAISIRRNRDKGFLGDLPIDSGVLRWGNEIWTLSEKGNIPTRTSVIDIPSSVALINGEQGTSILYPACGSTGKIIFGGANG